MRVFIINSGVSNISSVINMVKWVGFEPVVTQNLKNIDIKDKIIFPGIGNFGKAMFNLTTLGIVDQIKECVIDKKINFLGICLGMQLLMEESEESPGIKGLGLIKGKVSKFDFNQLNDKQSLKIPHVGWNKLSIKKESSIFNNYDEERSKYYFVHSYYVKCKSDENILAVSNYGYDFHSIVYKDNVYGFQFHPEKSLRYGANLIKNFCEI
ncbi:MAG: imidazole glycerol phosphate synthase subunit HisH [Candidatus Marinimicrobia bacterium]|nr:imidazole glycerol phosphate synthase subunit HisH [Candidatus Neomarinimicrobiota bacterium]